MKYIDVLILEGNKGWQFYQSACIDNFNSYPLPSLRKTKYRKTKCRRHTLRLSSISLSIFLSASLNYFDASVPEVISSSEEELKKCLNTLVHVNVDRHYACQPHPLLYIDIDYNAIHDTIILSKYILTICIATCMYIVTALFYMYTHVYLLVHVHVHYVL